MSRRLASTAVPVAPGPVPAPTSRVAEQPVRGRRGHPSAPASTSGIGYIGGLDGIRAISVLAVLLYHAGLSWAEGGYLGVEVFFVISGYLITSLLLAERRTSGRIDLPHFWLRRARRLLPAMFAVVTATMLVSILYLRDEVASLRGDAVSALFYVTNWNFILTEKSYFEASGRPPLLQHLWSLSVEEQFYLVWPLLFAGGMLLFGRRAFAWAIAGGAVLSAVTMAVLYDPDSDAARNRVYLGTDTRASGLLIGCLLAFAWAPGRIRPDRTGRHAGLILDALGSVALVGILWMLHATGEFSPFLYRGGFVVLSVLTAVLIAAVVHPSGRLGRVLGAAPLRWVGLRSYGIYLWHWPVFQLTRPHVDLPLDDGPILFAVRMALSLGIAALSYRYLELPIRQGALGRGWKALRAASGADRDRLRQRWLAGAGSVAVVLLVVFVAAVTAQPPSPELTTAAAIDGQTDTRAIDPRNFRAGAVDPNAVADPFANQSTVSEAPSTTAGLTVGSDTGGTGATAGSVPGTTDPPPVTEASTVAPGPTVSTLPRLAPPLPGLKIALLGDSVMLGASPSVKELLGPNAVVSALQSRQVSDGIAILQGWKGAGWLVGAEVVIHLGNNGTFTDGQFDQMMGVLADAPRVVFVNVRVPRPWQDSVNDTIRRGVERHPGNTVFVDWYAFSEGKAGWFYDDGMHLRPDGAPHYATLIASAL